MSLHEAQDKRISYLISYNYVYLEARKVHAQYRKNTSGLPKFCGKNLSLHVLFGYCSLAAADQPCCDGRHKCSAAAFEAIH